MHQGGSPHPGQDELSTWVALHNPRWGHRPTMEPPKLGMTKLLSHKPGAPYPIIDIVQLLVVQNEVREANHVVDGICLHGERPQR